MNNYHFYTPKDFASDENFQDWVLHPDVKNTHFWQSWIQEHPEKGNIIREAAELVQSVRYHSYSLSEKEKEQLWESVKSSIDDAETEITSGGISFPKKRTTLSAKWKYLSAALFTGLVLISTLWVIRNESAPKNNSVSYHTGFGQVKKLLLPDSSEVTLNADSKLAFTEKDTEREVWLDGEAYFHVRHTPDNKKFIVHTFDRLSVEVLGTRFNVNSTGGQILVALQQGSVKLEIDDENDSNKTQLYLKPGEMIRYNKRKGDYTKKEVNIEKFDSWTNGILTMDNYSIQDASSFMQQVFGKKIIVPENYLMNNRVSGSMPIVYNADTMLIQFSKVFNVHFAKEGNDIRIEKNNP